MFLSVLPIGEVLFVFGLIRNRSSQLPHKRVDVVVFRKILKNKGFLLHWNFVGVKIRSKKLILIRPSSVVNESPVFDHFAFWAVWERYVIFLVSGQVWVLLRPYFKMNTLTISTITFATHTLTT